MTKRQPKAKAHPPHQAEPKKIMLGVSAVPFINALIDAAARNAERKRAEQAQDPTAGIDSKP
jgi:hypothetical protein